MNLSFSLVIKRSRLLYLKISIGSVLDMVFSAKDKDKENGNILFNAGCTLKVCLHVRQKLHEFAVLCDFKFDFSGNKLEAVC